MGPPRPGVSRRKSPDPRTKSGPLLRAPTPWVSWGLQAVWEGMGGALLWAPKAQGGPRSCAPGMKKLTTQHVYPLPAHLSWVSAICPLGRPALFPPLDRHKLECVTSSRTPFPGPRLSFQRCSCTMQTEPELCAAVQVSCVNNLRLSLGRLGFWGRLRRGPDFEVKKCTSKVATGTLAGRVDGSVSPTLPQ